MIDFYAFSDELIKIAEDAGAIAVPVVRRLPSDADQAMELIKQRIDKSKRTIIGHKNIAVPVEKLGPLEQYGFKKTRWAVPLPGEWPGTPSWRRDELHAHKMDDHYLMHKDTISPQGAIRAVEHWFHEGLPATRKRIGERSAAIIGT